MGTAHSVDELKGLIDPLAVYQEYVRLTRKGKRSLGLCPFHREKTPSFSVDSDNGLFYCFGCHKGGDLLQFLQEVESCTFPEALEILARKAGVTLEMRGQARGAAPDRRDRLRKALESASLFYRAQLAASQKSSSVWAYVARRGIGLETAKVLGLGFAPPQGGLLAQLSREGFRAEEAQEAGLLIDRGRGEWAERFRNRLLFPIRDVMGRTVGFGGRALGDEEPKYLNSPETPVFMKRDVLYGLDITKTAVRDTGQALLVEGYMDFLAVHQAGVPNAAATLGTALADGQVRLLKRYAREVVLNFDRDRAGVAAAQRAIQLLLAEGLRIRVVSLPEGKDPDEFIRARSPEAYQELVKNARPFFDFLVDLTEAKEATSTVEGRMAFLEALAPYLTAVADPIERQEYAKEVASRTGIETGMILKRLARASVGEKAPEPAPQARPVQVPVTEQVLVKGYLAFREEAEGVIQGLPPEALAALAVWPLLQSLRKAGRPEGPEQTSLMARIQAGCHEAPTLEDFMGAAEEVRGAYLRRRERDIQQQLKEASRRKDFGLIQILQRERMSLLEELHARDPG